MPTRTRCAQAHLARGPGGALHLSAWRQGGVLLCHQLPHRRQARRDYGCRGIDGGTPGGGGGGQTDDERVHDDLGIRPRKLIGDTGYGSAETLAWLVHERDIEPHIPVFDKSARSDGTFSRADFRFDREEDTYTCPANKLLKRRQRRFHDRPYQVPADGNLRYRARTSDCTLCSLKPQCCPGQPARKVMRSIHAGARDLTRALSDEQEWLVSRRERKKVEMLFAHLKRILRLDRLRLRGPCGARDEFHLAAAAQNLRKMAKLLPLGAPAMAT